LGGISALDELQFDTGEHLSEQLLKSSQESTVPYIVGLTEYLVNTIPIISSFLELLFERFSKNTFITKSADVIPIWQRNSAVRTPVNSHQYTLTNSTVLNKEPIVSNSIFDDLSCGSGESLVDTTISILKMSLLCFNILDLTGDHEKKFGVMYTTRSIHHTEFFLTLKLIFIFYYIKFSLINKNLLILNFLLFFILLNLLHIFYFFNF